MHEHDRSKLKQIINDPASTSEERAIAQQELHGDPLTQLEAELLQTVAKPDLSSVSFFDAQRFCKDRSFGASPEIAAATRQLYDKWLEAFFASESGRPYLEQIASHLRDHDFGEWRHAADEWRASGWKSTARLISVLQRIVDSPNHGNYHSEETVEECRLLAVEMRRRAGVQS
jgi:hypothetical protein